MANGIANGSSRARKRAARYVLMKASNTSWRNATPVISTAADRRQLPKKFKLAALNIRSLRHKVADLQSDLLAYNIDAAVVSETWQPGQTITTWHPDNRGGSYWFYNSGVETSEHSSKGVAIINNSELQKSVTDYEFVSPRLLRLRIEQEKKKFTIIGAYAPVAGEVNDADREKFYDDLQQLLDKIPATEILFLAGHFMQEWEAILKLGRAPSGRPAR